MKIVEKLKEAKFYLNKPYDLNSHDKGIILLNNIIKSLEKK